MKFNKLHISEAKLLDDFLEIQRGYCNIGNAYLDFCEELLEKGNFPRKFERNIKKALDSFSESLSTCEKLLKTCQKSDKPHFERQKADALFNLGNAFLIKGRYDNDFYIKALDFFSQSRDFARSISYALIEGKSYSSIGLIYLNKKNYDQALQNLLKDEQICQKEKDYNGLRASCENLALVYQGKKDYEEAEKSFKKALKVVDTYFPQDLLSRKEIQKNFEILQEEIRKGKKIEMELKAFYRRNDCDLKKAFELLQELIFELEDYKKAKELFYKVLKDSKEENPGFLMLYYGGIIEKNVGGSEKAKEFFEKADEKYREKSLVFKGNKEEIEEYVGFLINYGNFLDERKGTVEEIERIYWRSYDFAKGIEDNWNMRVSLNNLEILYESRGDKKKKERIMMRLKDFGVEEEGSEENSEVFSRVSFEEDEDFEEEEEISLENEEISEEVSMMNEEIYEEKGLVKEEKFERKEDYRRENHKEIVKKTQAVEVYSRYCEEHFLSEIDAIKIQINHKKLSLSNKNLGDSLLKPALKTLKYMDFCNEINFSYNHLTDKSLETLGKQLETENWAAKLQILDLSYNPFMNKGQILQKNLEILCEKARNLQRINVSGLKFSEEVFWKGFLKLKNIIELRCKGCGLCDLEETIEIEAQMLEFLDVSENNFTGKSIEFFLWKIPSLFHLDFSYNNTRKSLETLYKMRISESCELRILKLKDFSQYNCEDFSALASVEILNISYAETSFAKKLLDSFVDFFFKEKLAGNQVKGRLKVFVMKKLKENSFGNPLFLWQSLAKVLAHQGELECLDLEGNGLDYEETIEILKFVGSGLKKLNLTGNKIREIEKKNLEEFAKEIFRDLKEILI